MDCNVVASCGLRVALPLATRNTQLATDRRLPKAHPAPFIPGGLGFAHGGEDDARDVVEAAGDGAAGAVELLRLRRRAGDEDLDADGGQRGEVRLELALD